MLQKKPVSPVAGFPDQLIFWGEGVCFPSFWRLTSPSVTIGLVCRNCATSSTKVVQRLWGLRVTSPAG